MKFHMHAENKTMAEDMNATDNALTHTGRLEKNHVIQGRIDRSLRRIRGIMAIVGALAISTISYGCENKTVEDTTSKESKAEPHEKKSSTKEEITETKWKSLIDELDLSPAEAEHIKKELKESKWKDFMAKQDLSPDEAKTLKDFYLRSSKFGLEQVHEIIQIARQNKPEAKHIYALVKNARCNESVLRLVKFILKNVSYSEGELPEINNPNFITSKAGELDSLLSILNESSFDERFLNVMLEHPEKIIESICYLHVLFTNKDYKKVHSFAEVEKLAKKLNIDVSGPVFYYNLAYAIDVLGSEETELLYRQYNIRYFIRYPKRILQRMLKPPTGKQLMIYAFTTDDIGAFSGFTPIKGSEAVFDIRIHEIENEKQFYDVVPNGGVLVVKAHGNPKSARFAAGNDETFSLDVDDQAELSKLGKRPTLVIMESCSTGDGEDSIGAVLSGSLNTKVFAPTQPTGLKDVKMSNSEITDVTFWLSPRHIFINGKIID